MNLLTDKLPEQVEVDGRSYRIRTDFRIFIQFEELINNPDLTQKQKAFIEEIRALPDVVMDYESAVLSAKYADALELVYYEVPDNIEVAINKMLWFYQCGKTEEQKSARKRKKSQQIYSYTYDADYIYAAYFDQYGIDLNKEMMHWWVFSSLFTGLKEDCLISKIMLYRSIDTVGMDSEQRKFYRKMKRIYALPEAKSEEDQKIEDDVTNALLNGGDLTGILQ